MTAEKPFTEPTDEMLRAFYGGVYPAIDDHQKRWDGKRISALLDSGLVVPASKPTSHTDLAAVEAERDALRAENERLAGDEKTAWYLYHRAMTRLDKLTEAAERVVEAQFGSAYEGKSVWSSIASLRSALNQEDTDD